MRRREGKISVQDWLAEHRAHVWAEDPHRAITTEDDLSDPREERAEAVRQVQPAPVDAAETAVADIREIAAGEPAPVARADEGRGRVAATDETATAVERAQRALLELRARTAAERRRAAEEARRIDQAYQHRRERTATEAATARADVVER